MHTRNSKITLLHVLYITDRIHTDELEVSDLNTECERELMAKAALLKLQHFGDIWKSLTAYTNCGKEGLWRTKSFEARLKDSGWMISSSGWVRITYKVQKLSEMLHKPRQWSSVIANSEHNRDWSMFEVILQQCTHKSSTYLLKEDPDQWNEWMNERLGSRLIEQLNQCTLYKS